MRTTCTSAKPSVIFLSLVLCPVLGCASPTGAGGLDASGDTVVADSGTPLSYATGVLPRSLEDCMRAFPKTLVVSREINPFYLRGDFDGDGENDLAFLVSEEDKRGIAFCFHADRTPRVLGAIDELEGGLDLVFDHWVMYPRQRVEQGAEEGEPPTLRGEAVLILISESGSSWSSDGSVRRRSSSMHPCSSGATPCPLPGSL